MTAITGLPDVNDNPANPGTDPLADVIDARRAVDALTRARDEFADEVDRIVNDFAAEVRRAVNGANSMVDAAERLYAKEIRAAQAAGRSYRVIAETLTAAGYRTTAQALHRKYGKTKGDG